ncbi:MAG: metallophosphoesterase family protein, partial [Myxococcales bacterium]|nr:metallophosphoesterase family protein [Myxococcales bacterium]
MGIISDTHGWLHPFIYEAFQNVDLIIHAGDIGTPAVLADLETIAPVAAVKGNIDGGELLFLPEELVEEIGGRKIAVRHICGNPQRPNRAALDLIRRTRPDVLVTGHS